MAGYDIYLSDGDLLTSIAEKTVDTRLASSLVLIGKGSPNFWKANDQNFAWMLENFSAATPPVHPLEGQLWHDRAHDQMDFYRGNQWYPLLTPETTADGLFDMLGSATNIDFTVTGSTPIFTIPDPTKTYCPTLLILVLRGPDTVTSPAVINLSALTPGDVLSTVTVPLETDEQFVRLPTNNICRMLSYAAIETSAYGGGQYGIGPYSAQYGAALTVSINVTTAATGGDLHYDAYLFGLVTAFVGEARVDLITMIEEIVSATDTSAARAVYQASIEEVVSVTDLATGLGIHPASVNETASAADLATGLGIHPASVNETASAADLATGLGTYPGGVNETASAADLATGLGTYPGGVNETASAADASVGQGAYHADLDEAASAADQVVSPGYGEGLYGLGLYGDSGG